MSHRSGETNDATSPISPSPPTAARSRPAPLVRSDRLANYNQLLRIEQQLGDQAAYAGRQAIKRL